MVDGLFEMVAAGVSRKTRRRVNNARRRSRDLFLVSARKSSHLFLQKVFV